MLASHELNEVWALDFMCDTLYDGWPVRTLNVIDEGNREALRIDHKGLRRFTLRGKARVDTHWQLYCLVHNIEKLAHRVWQ